MLLINEGKVCTTFFRIKHRLFFFHKIINKMSRNEEQSGNVMKNFFNNEKFVFMILTTPPPCKAFVMLITRKYDVKQEILRCRVLYLNTPC